MAKVRIPSIPGLNRDKIVFLFRNNFNQNYEIIETAWGSREDFIVKKSEWTQVAVSFIPENDQILFKLWAVHPTGFAGFINIVSFDLPLLFLTFSTIRKLKIEIKEFLKNAAP